VISDFWADDYEHALTICARKHDTIAVQITDRREEIPMGAGLIKFADAETGREEWVDTDSRAWAEHIRRDAREFEARLAGTLRRCGTDRIKLVAGESFVLELGQFFKRRAKKLVWA
jgi:hypothetical protein